ncbi:hypothetical protein WOLCODRAFT_159473 [Wolfiporia cocos MD-104 SS10]|uniref:Uncharacterized protein n=1 Tax=Wolfiporia cocos (strain MD-104) TaxID=742152 RepID=A0A2H3J1Z1_WOLCO|nr:hypothetical protein WOLCODRAFT_159473 [Wolfiporia cocos MD-104 SS10]
MCLAVIHYVLYNIQAIPAERRLWHSSLALEVVIIYILNPLMYPPGNFPQKLQLTAKTTCWVYLEAESSNGNGSDNSYVPSEDELHEPCAAGNHQGIYFIREIKVQKETLTYLYNVGSINNLYKVFGFCCAFREEPKTHPTRTKRHRNTLQLEHVRANVPADFEFGLDKENIRMQPVVPPMTREEDKLEASDADLKEEWGSLNHQVTLIWHQMLHNVTALSPNRCSRQLPLYMILTVV